jgi:uncharacterized protein YbjT (DUF2867 family)
MARLSSEDGGMPPTLLITGATGMVGSEIVRQLSASGSALRALVHNPEKSASIKKPGVEIVVGDLERPHTLPPALEGIATVLLMSSPDPAQVELQGNMVDAAKRAGARRIVKVSAVGAGPKSPASLGRWHYQTEKEVESSGLAWTHLRPHSFMQNFLMSAASLKKEGRLFGCQRDGRAAFVDVRDIAAVATAVLTGTGHDGKAYAITGPQALSLAEAAKALGAAVGRPVSYVDLPPAEFKAGLLAAGLSEWMANDLVAFQTIFAQGLGSEVTDVVARDAGRPATRLEQFARDHRRAFSAH